MIGSHLSKRTQLLCVAIMMCNQGCRHATSSQPTSAIHLNLADDTSASCNDQRPAYIRLVVPLICSLDKSRDWLTLSRLDCVSTPFHDRRPVVSRDNLIRILTNNLKAPARENGTAFHKFWKWVADQHHEAGLVVIVITDGIGDGMSRTDYEMLHAAIRKLAASNDLRAVALLGIDPSVMNETAKEFEPISKRLGTRGFLMMTKGDIDPEPLQELLQNARIPDGKDGK